MTHISNNKSDDRLRSAFMYSDLEHYRTTVVEQNMFRSLLQETEESKSWELLRS